MLLIQNFLDGEQFDDPTSSLVEGGAFAFGVFGVAEGDEEAALATAFALALHDGLECVNVGTADLVGLLDLNREPVIGEHAIRVGGLCSNREDAAVDSHVADL